MKQRSIFNKVASVLVLTLVIVQTTGCGTLLHPERRGQTSGRIDPGVAVLNGVGLLLFVVPGLVAFVIDFSTGAIYLPPGHGKLDDTEKGMRVVYSDVNVLSKDNINRVVAEGTGYSGVMEHENIKISKIKSTDEFMDQIQVLIESSEVHKSMM